MNARDFLLAKALGKGSGASLPTLSSPASASDIYQGTEAIDQAGAVVVGTNPYNAAVVDPVKASALTAIADKGVATTGDEALSEIPGLIDDIVTPNNQDKTITENGTYTADAGYTGLGTVTVDVASSGGNADTLDGLIARSIVEISNRTVETVGRYAFYSFSKLQAASFQACKTVEEQAFNNCIGLVTISFPECTRIENYAFNNCLGLVSVVGFPKCETVRDFAFGRCSSVEEINFPMCATVGFGAFASCFGITAVDFPECKTVGSSAFLNCSNLAKASLPVCTRIEPGAFRSCNTLSAVILAGSSVCSLGGSNAFTYAALIQNGTGYIYVPSSLVDAYKSATNWTYFSNQISAIEDSEFA